jgi:hypothetical protein
VQDVLAFSWGFQDGVLLVRSAAKQAGVTIAEVAEKSQLNQVLDMCSGGGGPIAAFAELPDLKNCIKSFIVTDLYPNLVAFKQLAAKHPGRIEFSEKPVDATACTYGELKQSYIRTMFASLHHMTPFLVEGILRDIVDKEDSFVAVELTNRSFLAISIFAFSGVAIAALGILSSLPKVSISSNLARMLLTFVFPIIPFLFIIDGVVSCIRTYSSEEFLLIAKKADPESKYDWTVKEKMLQGAPYPVTVYVGVPKSKSKHSKVQ